MTTVGAAQMPAAPNALAAAAPAAPAALTPPAPNAGVELDSAGLPWDGRIHASTKTKNKTDGTWRAKRDLDLALKAGVEAELRQVLALNASAAPVAAPAAAPAAPPAMTPVAVPIAAPAAPAAVAPVASFGDLMERLTPLMMTGQVKTDQVSQVLAAHGLSGIGQLALAPNLVPVVAAELLGASA
nr:hypothetical protein [Ralstonia sp.]